LSLIQLLLSLYGSVSMSRSPTEDLSLNLTLYGFHLESGGTYPFKAMTDRDFKLCGDLLKDKLKDIRHLRSDETFNLIVEVMQEYAHGKDRDFKLLVREYLVNEMKPDCLTQRLTHRKLQDKIWKELERFTLEDVEELPFKDNEQ
jgi:hypothetical protein